MTILFRHFTTECVFLVHAYVHAGSSFICMYPASSFCEKMNPASDTRKFEQQECTHHGMNIMCM